MSDTQVRPQVERMEHPSDVPDHPHFTLGSVAVIALVAALVASVLGMVAVGIVASRNSVDDELVTRQIDEALATGAIAAAPVGADVGESVLPAIVPKAELGPVPAGEVNVAVAPLVPPAATRAEPAIVDVTFELVENVATIDPASGIEFETWGYRLVGSSEGAVIGTPGPIIRARVGDLLRFTIINPDTNTHPHNVDFHAVTGQGGGAADTVVAPGETKTIEARLLYPGFFMYHCAYGDVPAHISHGMYGGILVDPATPLPAVDREWYIVQSEYYTTDGETGLLDLDRTAVTAEEPDFVVFNGARGAIAGDGALQMNVGERARIYFVNAGLNLTSNFHPIGSHWDTVYAEAATLNAPLRGSQTTLVPAGGGTIVELIGQVPSTIILVDHALSRTFDKGAAGQIVVSGDPQPEIFAAIDTGGQSSAADDEGGDVAADVAIDIAVGSGDPQDLDHPDEFSESESPVDYSVNLLEVAVGTTVTWTNRDELLHTVSSVDDTFDSGFLAQDETWSYTFTEEGEFEYFCLPHPWMRAKVIVTS